MTYRQRQTVSASETASPLVCPAVGLKPAHLFHYYKRV
jgi:hypothetical protein